MNKVNKNKNNLLLRNGGIISRSSYFINPYGNYFDEGGDENNKENNKYIIPDSINDIVKSDNFGSILSSAGTIINSGISKINVNSDIQDVWHKEVVKFINENPNVYDPRKVIMSGANAMKEFIDNQLFTFF